MALTLREARVTDLPELTELLANDPLGRTRERLSAAGEDAYRSAFDAIDRDPHHSLLVAESEGAVVAVLQLSFLPHLTYEGRWRAQIEGVRVGEAHRDAGVGRALIEEAISRAERRGCHLVQLTTDNRRPDALRFYESLGFSPSHVGLKLHLSGRTP